MTSDLSESIGFIDPKSAETYLLAHGWDLKKETPLFSRWDRDSGETRHLFLPRSTELADFKDRMFEFVARLAAVEHQDERLTATNLRYAAADLIRLRLSGPTVTASGELPIQDGARLFDGARHLMEAAACSAVQPRAQFGSRRPDQAKKFVKGVRLGQTERGSYVITVISDVPPPEQQALVADEEDELQVPFERKVTRVLVDALTQAQKLSKEVLDHNKEIGDFQDAIEAGVSSNLCDAITDIAAESPTDLGINVNWAAARPVDDEQPSAIKFGPAELPIIEDARDVLRQMGPFDNTEVIGSVKRLDRPAEEAIGEIVIEGHADGERRSVRIALSDAEYHRAISAHEDRRLVSFRGTLERDGRRWVLSDPGQIKILDSDIDGGAKKKKPKKKRGSSGGGDQQIPGQESL